MVDVDRLNEEIKQFGVVVERMNELPQIYEDVKVQLDACREASNELKLVKEDMEKFISSTKQDLEHQHNETVLRISNIETNLEQKFDKMELNLRDRLALVESNTTIALNELKASLEKNFAELNQRLDTEANIRKKRFIILTVCVGMAIVLAAIKFFI